MTYYAGLAARAYEHAEQHYGDKGARYDVIVECMSLGEIAEALADDGNIVTVDQARAWADRYARLQHEVELNQAWDGPESCIGSPLYNHKYDIDGNFLE